MVELADTPDLGSGAVRRTGSSPAIRTTTEPTVDTMVNCRFVIFYPKTALCRVLGRFSAPQRTRHRCIYLRVGPYQQNIEKRPGAWEISQSPSLFVSALFFIPFLKVKAAVCRY